MNLITNPDKSQWTELLKRPVMNTENLFDTVRSIIDRVKAEGSGEIGDYARSVIARNLGVNPEAPADNSTTPEPTLDRTR